MKSNMKKYIIFILVIALALATFLIVNTMQIEKANSKTFAQAGYILKNQVQGNLGSQSVERYYFNANEKYKNAYGEKVVFNDSNGEKIVTTNDNFIHYTDGSIGALKKGVIMDFSRIDDDPILYYNIASDKIIKKKSQTYTVSYLNKDLEFSNFIWKISDNKYLIAGQGIKVVINDEEAKTIDGYIELEYSDNEVVRIYNQELTYQTISSKCYIELPNEIIINIASKIVSKSGINKMSLSNMVIDSDDNIDIVDLEEEQEENEEDNQDENSTNTQNNTTENTTNSNNNNIQDQNNINNPNNNQNNNNSNQNNNENNNSGNDNNQNSGNADNNTTGQTNGQNQIGGIISGGTITPGGDEITEDGNTTVGDITDEDDELGDDEENEEGEETEVVERPEVNIPTYKVEDFEVDSISMKAQIVIEDKDSILTGDNNIKILKNDTGKTVYETQEPMGVFNIEVNVSTLLPDTEYTLVIQSSYTVDEIEYTRNFIYKIFRTQAIGISIEKDSFTNTSLRFGVTIEQNSKVKSAEVVIMDKQTQEVLQTYSIEQMNIGQKNIVDFVGLDPNTEYKVGIINILYDGQVIADGFEISDEYKTLKNQPEISGTEFEIDKRNGSITLNLSYVKDEHKGILNYTYELYDTRNDLETAEPVYSITKTENSPVTVTIDNEKISRGVPYVFKVVIEFSDNEKIVEYESEYSDIIQIDGVEFPTVRFESKVVTFERIEGNLIIEDKNNTISLDDNNIFTIIYTDSVGVNRSFTSKGSLTIPVSVNDLRANETYKFSIYTRVDLQDGNDPIDECYIGGAVVKTTIPNNMVAKFAENEEDTKNAFNVSFKLENEEGNTDTLEAQTLTGMEFNIYAGQTATGTPLRTVKVVDSNIEPYESNLKADYFDKGVSITPEFFGAQNRDFRDRYYTITVSKAYDYTQYPNALPIIENSISIETIGTMPDLPADINNAIEVEVIRNRDKDQREDLDAETVVGYKIKAGYDNSQKYAKTITYKVYNAVTNELIETRTIEIGEDGLIPSTTFDVGDGTLVKDTDEMRRGNSYYFTYEVDLDLNNDGEAESKYPYTEEGQEEIVLKSKTVTPKKQEAHIVMYPSISTENSITFKYKFSDIDNAIELNVLTGTKTMQALINNSLRDAQEIEETTDDEWKEITFKNLVQGNLNIYISQALLKDNVAENKILAEQQFEGKVLLDQVQYNVSLDSNRVIVTLLGNEDQIDRIANVTVEFETADGTKFTKENLIPTNNIITVNLNELGNFRKKEVFVNLYAKYDTGIVGYDLTSQYVVYQNASTLQYYTISSENKFTQTITALRNAFQYSRQGNVLNITQIGTNKSMNLELQYSEKGFLYEYDPILQKAVEEEKVKSDGSNIIRFDVIIPGISMTDSSGELSIKTELDKVEFRAAIISTDIVTFKDNLIYIDLYETDENGRTEKFIQTINKKISDFDSIVQIPDLRPKTYYFMKFRTNIILDNGQVEEKELYDIDFQVVGKKYYFSTLATVGITDIEIKYNPVNYENKTIDISYKLDKILGYKKIVYTLYKYNNETSSYEVLEDGLEDTLLKKEMLKQLDASPGSKFIFGTNYKIKITPIAEYTSLEGTTSEIELGTVEKEFTLEDLKTPLIGINGYRPSNTSIRFKITMYDEDRIVENDKYTITILDNKQQDITPEEYKKEYSTDIINNTITIEGIEQTKEYTIIVKLKADYDNDRKDLADYEKRYTIPYLNKNGVSIGNISTSGNIEQSNKIDLIFNNSYKLTEIDQVRYSIYNNVGYAKSGLVEFIPVEITSQGEVYYKFTLEEQLEEVGRYYIELQFLKDGKIIDTATTEHIYIED